MGRVSDKKVLGAVESSIDLKADGTRSALRNSTIAITLNHRSFDITDAHHVLVQENLTTEHLDVLLEASENAVRALLHG